MFGLGQCVGRFGLLLQLRRQSVLARAAPDRCAQQVFDRGDGSTRFAPATGHSMNRSSS